MFTPDEYTSRPRPVLVKQVTHDNMADVAEWCGGTIETGTLPDPIIRVKAYRPQSKRQTEAHVGDWVVKQGKGFKVFLNDSFPHNFEKKRVEVLAAEIPFAPLGTPTEGTPVFDLLIKEITQGKVAQLSTTAVVTRIMQELPAVLPRRVPRMRIQNDFTPEIQAIQQAASERTQELSTSDRRELDQTLPANPIDPTGVRRVAQHMIPQQFTGEDYVSGYKKD